MTSLTVKDASNAFELNVDYRFSATANDGKLTSMKNNVSGEEVAYGYDSLARLTSASTVVRSGVWLGLSMALAIACSRILRRVRLRLLRSWWIR